MEGFYDKKETARILGVSTRQINNYITEEKLSRIYVGKKLWIPVEDVQRMYNRITRGPLLGQEAMYDLCARVENLERSVETLKLGLGYGATGEPRTKTDLLLLRQKCLDLMARKSWRTRTISQVADELMKVQPVEIESLDRAFGPLAWTPLCDISTRMLIHVENREDYPAKGLDALHARLIKSRDRFFGMVYAATKVKLGVSDRTAQRILTSVEKPPTSIDECIVNYVLLERGSP